MKKLVYFFIAFMLFCCQAVYANEITKEQLDNRICGKAAILVDPQTGKILYEKNAYMPWHPASTTKIMTALLILERGKMTDSTTISRNATNLLGLYNSRYLYSGLTFTIDQLLHMLLIESDNAACKALAEYLCGNQVAFVEQMNLKAKELGLSSHFTTAYGMTDDEHYVTAYDLYRIAYEDMKYPLFREIVRKGSYHLSTNQINLNIVNVNKLLGQDPRVLGVKTGYTRAAQCNLVCYAEDNGYKLYSVVLGSPRGNVDYSYPDTQLLLNYGFQELKKNTYYQP